MINEGNEGLFVFIIVFICFSLRFIYPDADTARSSWIKIACIHKTIAYFRHFELIIGIYYNDLTVANRSENCKIGC